MRIVIFQRNDKWTFWLLANSGQTLLESAREWKTRNECMYWIKRARKAMAEAEVVEGVAQ